MKIHTQSRLQGFARFVFHAQWLAQPFVLLFVAQMIVAFLASEVLAQGAAQLQDRDWSSKGSLMLLESFRIFAGSMRSSIKASFFLLLVALPLVELARFQLLRACYRLGHREYALKKGLELKLLPPCHAFDSYAVFLLWELLHCLCSLGLFTLSLLLAQNILEQSSGGFSVLNLSQLAAVLAIFSLAYLSFSFVWDALKVSFLPDNRNNQRDSIPLLSFPKLIAEAFKCSVQHFSSLLLARALRACLGLVCTLMLLYLNRLQGSENGQSLSLLVGSQALVALPLTAASAWYVFLSTRLIRSAESNSSNSP